MPDLLAALDAFVQEHRRCGDLDGRGGEWPRVDGLRLRRRYSVTLTHTAPAASAPAASLRE
jgi:hypothetical protein